MRFYPMFHVEHFGGFLVFSTLPLTILAIALFFSLCGCKKSDPEPEKKDFVYLSLGNEIKTAEAEVAAASIAVGEAEGEIKKVVPQTGQIKYAEKRYWEARNRLTRAEQALKAAQLKAEMRMWSVRVESLAAFHQGKELNGNNANDSYILQKALDQKSKNWSVKERRAALGLPSGRNIEAAGTAAGAAGGGHGAASADSHAAPAAEAGH